MRRTLSYALPYVLLALTSTAWGSAPYPYVPRAVLILEADLVAVGKIVSVTTNAGESIASLKVEKTLYGPDELRSVRIAWGPGAQPPEDPMNQPLDLADGMQGIWFLRRQTASDEFDRPTPDCHLATTELAAVEAEIKAVGSLQWSTTNRGLQMALVVEPTDVRSRSRWINRRLVQAQATVAVFPVARNVGDGELRVCDWAAHHPFTARWSRRGGRSWQPQLYSGAKSTVAPPASEHYRLIRPGEIRRIGHGFVLPPLLQEGDYVLSLSFTCEPHGAANAAPDTWHGSIALPEYRLHLPIDE